MRLNDGPGTRPTNGQPIVKIGGFAYIGAAPSYTRGARRARSLTYLSAVDGVRVYDGANVVNIAPNLDAARVFAERAGRPLKPKGERDWRANFKD